MGKLRPQPFESFLLSSLFVPTNQITDVLTDIFVGAVVAHVRSHEIAQRLRRTVSVVVPDMGRFLSGGIYYN